MGNGAPRENRPITGYVVDDHKVDNGIDDGLGSLRAAMAIGYGEGMPGPHSQPSEERMENWDERQQNMRDA